MLMRHHNPSNISFSYIFIAKLYSPLVALNDVESLLLKRKQFKPADWFLCFSTPKYILTQLSTQGQIILTIFIRHSFLLGWNISIIKRHIFIQ